MNLKRGSFNSKAQIWVETVIYTLIGLTIMGIILSVVTPKINQINDRALLSQTKEAMTQINEQVQEILSSTGQQRDILLTVKKGEYFIDGPGNSISFILKGTGAPISEPDQVIKSGEINILTKTKTSGKYDVYFVLNYSQYNITYSGKDVNKTFTPAPAGYRLLLINAGSSSITGTKQIDIKPIGA